MMHIYSVLHFLHSYLIGLLQVYRYIQLLIKYDRVKQLDTLRHLVKLLDWDSFIYTSDNFSIKVRRFFLLQTCLLPWINIKQCKRI